MTNLENTPLEIERKFLIEYPDTQMLRKLPDCKVKEIVQTYLLCENGTMRVRKTLCCGKTTYRFNEKHSISAISRTEEEKELSEAEYNLLLTRKDGSRSAIEKVRYAFPFGEHILEIDVYPFWSDRAILEIELSCEDEEYVIPEFIRVIKEVTGDNRYSNKSLAKCIINEKL